MAGCKLVISDLQVPFEHPKALGFVQYVKRHYQILDEDVYNVGDEVDQYWGGQWPKDIEADVTSIQEIQASIATLHEWYRAFPRMKLCNSNHGDRWIRKALAAEIPSLMMRDYREVLQAPMGWQWAKNWLVDDKHPWKVEHGDDYGSQYPATMAAKDNGISMAIGHHHSKFGVEFIRTAGLDIWAAVTGCLIDDAKVAFRYNKKARYKPRLGLLVVADNGKMPILVPFNP